MIEIGPLLQGQKTEEQQVNEIISRVRNDVILPPELSFPSSATTAIIASSVHSIFDTTGYLGIHILAQILALNGIANVTCLMHSEIRMRYERFEISMGHVHERQR